MRDESKRKSMTSKLPFLRFYCWSCLVLIGLASCTTDTEAPVLRLYGLDSVMIPRGRGVGVKGAAVRVNSAMTVFAAEVRMASTSGVGSMGVAGAQAARINAAVSVRIINLTFIFPLLLFLNNGC